MGYTHYFRRPPGYEFSQDVWDTLCAEVEKMVDTLLDDDDTAVFTINGDPLYVMPDGNEDNTKICTKNAIGFNGADGPDAPNLEYPALSHETFYLTRYFEDCFEFCKTVQKPYDLLVVAVLFRAQMLANWLVVTSDASYEEWLPGMRFAQLVLGEKVIPNSEIEKMKEVLS